MMESDTQFRTQTLNALFEHATEGIIIVNKEGTIVKSNPSSERLFGYGKDQLAGRVIEELVPHQYIKSHLGGRHSFMARPNARPMGKNMELYGRRRDNSEFPVEISLSYYKQDNEPFVIAFIIDVTERKKHEANVIRLNHELEKKVEERTQVLQEALIELENSKEKLRIALEAEKELNDMKSRFVTMASHEFRTPLSTILSSISLVNKYDLGENSEKVSKHVQKIKSAVTNMTLILNDFLSAEKLEEGMVFVRKEQVPLQALTREVIGEIQGILKKGQQVKYVHEGLPTAHIDAQMIKNILLNLISNAIKFSPEASPIHVSTLILPKEVRITVEDKGFGIPKEEQPHLFERFFRARNVVNIQGTGLGLNIVAKYLDSMHGKINFKSELDKGTIFNVSIPNS